MARGVTYRSQRTQPSQSQNSQGKRRGLRANSRVPRSDENSEEEVENGGEEEDEPVNVFLDEGDNDEMDTQDAGGRVNDVRCVSVLLCVFMPIEFLG
jgi:hypothetical protein